MTEVVYFARIGEDGPIKIGITSCSPDYRISALQGACPWPVLLMGTVPGDRQREIFLHRLLADHRMRGEWFAPHPTVVETVSAIIEARFSWEAAPSNTPRSAALASALQAVGAAALAKSLGVTAQAISQWRDVPALRALEVERITGVPRQTLRPDIYPVEAQP